MPGRVELTTAPACRLRCASGGDYDALAVRSPPPTFRTVLCTARGDHGIAVPANPVLTTLHAPILGAETRRSAAPPAQRRFFVSGPPWFHAGSNYELWDSCTRRQPMHSSSMYFFTVDSLVPASACWASTPVQRGLGVTHAPRSVLCWGKMKRAARFAHLTLRPARVRVRRAARRSCAT